MTNIKLELRIVYLTVDLEGFKRDQIFSITDSLKSFNYCMVVCSSFFHLKSWKLIISALFKFILTQIYLHFDKIKHVLFVT